jgi:hypothetical protein
MKRLGNLTDNPRVRRGSRNKTKQAALALTITLAMSAASTAATADFRSSCAAPPAAGGRSLRATPASLAGIVKMAQPGDTIVLEGGHYGQVRLVGKNAGFISLVAQAGQTPVLSSLAIGGSHWIVRGVTIDGSSGPSQNKATPPGRWPQHEPMVRTYNSDNIMLLNSYITSRPGQFPWQEERQGIDNPVALYSAIVATYGSCLTISHNSIENVFNGIAIGGNQVGENGKHYVITDNRIDHYAGDGIDHSVSDALIARNTITNNMDICNYQCIHSDGIQGWNLNNLPGIVNTDIVIDRNYIIQRLTHDPFNGNIHGIAIFDGTWRNVRVTNNVVATNHWHGITISGVDGLLVANNTVVATDPARKTWILAGGTTHQGATSKNVTVRNNIATDIQSPKVPVANMRVDHNLVIGDPHRVFVEFNLQEGRFDFHLRPGSPAIGRGSPEVALQPNTDSASHPARVDLGAFPFTR